MQASIYNISPIDATVGGVIKFSWTGNQVFKNRCILKNNETGATVYDNTITTFQFEHAINLSKATLENGKKYNAYITVFDKDNVESDIPSVGMLFYCLKTPTFKFENITDGQVLRASSYAMSLSYAQENGELLNSWSITLYTRSHSELTTSGTKYVNDLKHTFYGFENNQEYSIRGRGETINGIVLDTGFVNISVSYIVNDVFSLLVPENLKKIGAIRIGSNIVSSEGHGDKNLSYIDNNSVDLIDNVIHFTDGFKASGDFSYVQKFCGVKVNDFFITLTGDNVTITVAYRIVKFTPNNTMATYEMKVKCNGLIYTLYSNYISVPADDDVIGLCFYRENGLYNINVVLIE